MGIFSIHHTDVGLDGVTQVKRSRMSEVSNRWPGSRAHLRALEAFGFLMLKYTFSHILETLFL